VNKKQIKKEIMLEVEKLVDEKLNISIVSAITPDVLETGQKYWYITSFAIVDSTTWVNSYTDNYRLYHNNVFLDEKECAIYNDIDKKLHKLALELNQKEPVDWNNKKQEKEKIKYEKLEKKRLKKENNINNYNWNIL